jgi:SAM-dependent methyltransferase
MTDSPLADVVARQYERWVYPAPIQDLQSWAQNNWQWFDPAHAHRVLWPDKDYRRDLDILVAGCGTNQAAVFAYNNPAARVLAVDVSKTSLDHHKFLKNKHGLSNLETMHLPIEELPTLKRDFDLIISTGVLHHMAEPKDGMKALAKCLRKDGAIAIMLYAHYGRIGVEIAQSIFKDLNLEQDDASLRMVRETITLLSSAHPLRSYLSIAPDLQFDAGLVDTFLHGRERSYTVDDCIDLVKSADLEFQEWFFKAPYYPPQLSASRNEFVQAMEGRPREEVWAFMERINTLNGCHFFIACSPDRDKKTYQIDFSSETSLDYVPMMRYRAGVRGAQIFRSDWAYDLDPTELALVLAIDGQRSIREIAHYVGKSGLLVKEDADRAEEIARILFRNLWQADFLNIGINS